MVRPTPCHIPIEVLSGIVDRLDPIADRPTLLVLLRVSKAIWDMSARRLYRDIALDNAQMSKIVRRLSPRGRIALGFIRSMKLCPSPRVRTVLKMYAAAGVSHEPLFPNVQRLVIHDKTCIGDDTDGPGDGELPSAPPGILLFDSPRICLWGKLWVQDRILLCRSLSLTLHCGPMKWVWESTLPRPYRSLRLYWASTNHRTCGRGDIAPLAKLADQASFWATKLPILVYALTTSSTPRRALSPLEKARRFYELEAKGNVELFLGDNPPPCDVCGASLEPTLR